MKQRCFELAVVLCLTAVAWQAWGYGEGPSDSGRWIYGTVTYGDGSSCSNCCRISLETRYGFSSEGCTNGDGNYKIFIASDYVKRVYYRGSTVWEGSKDARGGARIDIRAR